ncbi:MAG: PadR family transcriptional regulator [Actinomycetota bacterium]|nr:PadR family transcriptional regulator [Actinomycetota bacterium]
MKQPGMLEMPVLGLLKERSMHGYELRKQLGAMLGPFWQVSWGSLYPTLRRLAKAGAVEKVVEQAVKPKAKSRARTARSSPRAAARSTATGTGRRRTVYRVTPVGDEMFTQMLEETGGTTDTETFTIKLAFFRYLDPDTRVALLERRRAYLQEKLAQFRSNLRNYKERMDTYALSLQSHDMAATETDIAWIDELISKERSLEIPRAETTSV